MYITQYLPPAHGNSFRLVVKIRDSGPKGPRFKTTHCHSGDPDEPRNNYFQSHYWMADFTYRVPGTPPPLIFRTTVALIMKVVSGYSNETTYNATWWKTSKLAFVSQKRCKIGGKCQTRSRRALPI
ncbi:hypothetical protein AVEN_119120-1 [Araneus ventricosus]|uniref:Uncharacterized protein n=1 Tax=Araneus ventricosus TaxID=182803 RepID=A0A4Y2BLB4_ARAVE|nr:hypothetical protein AVEN_119120-1 [Araneus ventricosus]